MARCPNISHPKYKYALTCECVSCSSLRAEQGRLNADRCRAMATRPVLSGCPLVTRGNRYAVGCSCKSCVAALSALRVQAAASRALREPDIDEIAVDQFLAGYRMQLNRDERREVVRRIMASPARHGDPTDWEIAEKFGVHVRTIERDKKEMRRA